MAGRPSRLAQVAPQEGFALRVRPLNRLPALLRFPGHNPAQLAQCSASGNTLISGPSSASKVQAVMTSMPGIVSKRRNCSA